MNRLRSRILVSILFCLISLGQAYPLSLAYGMEKRQHACGCSGTMKVCDCDHDHHHDGSTKASHHHQASESHHKKSCHQKKMMGYAKAPCGEKSESQILSFQNEPFLVGFNRAVFFKLITHSLQNLSPLTSQLTFVPESPPPKI